MGADGHIASLFPGSTLDGDDPRQLIETMPDPVPINAPVPRLSWNLTALTQTNRTLLVCAGKAKRAAFERAPTSSEPSPLDRKSVVSGKRVTVQVDLGGRRII